MGNYLGSLVVFVGQATQPDPNSSVWPPLYRVGHGWGEHSA